MASILGLQDCRAVDFDAPDVIDDALGEAIVHTYGTLPHLADAPVEVVYLIGRACAALKAAQEAVLAWDATCAALRTWKPRH